MYYEVMTYDPFPIIMQFEIIKGKFKVMPVLMLGYGYLDCLPCLSLGFLVGVTLMLLFLSLLLSIHYYSCQLLMISVK